MLNYLNYQNNSSKRVHHIKCNEIICLFKLQSVSLFLVFAAAKGLQQTNPDGFNK